MEKYATKPSSGYLKPTGINIFTTTEREELYEKLYNFLFFPSYTTLNDIYVSWITKDWKRIKL